MMLCICDQRVTTDHVYEVQMSNSQRTIANLEELVRNVEEEKHNLMLDLSAARDLCSTLESAKDGLQRQLVSKALDHEKVFTSFPLVI